MNFERISDGGISRPKGAYRAAQAAYRAASISNPRRGYIDKKRSVDMSRRANPSGLDICLTAFDMSLRTRYALRASLILGNREQHLGLGSAEVGHTAVVKDHGGDPHRTAVPARVRHLIAVVDHPDAPVHGSGEARKPCGSLFSIRMELNLSVRTNFTRRRRISRSLAGISHTAGVFHHCGLSRFSPINRNHSVSTRTGN